MEALNEQKTVAGNREVVILPDAKGIAHTAAAEFLTAAREAVLERNSFSVALAGGSTPKALYGLLSTNALLQALVPWSKIQWFFGDERHVGPDDPDSNFRMASETMLSKAPVNPNQVHRIKGEKADAVEAAAEYEDELRSSLRLDPSELPRFDLVLLGMGAEGHTASLFPGTKALKAVLEGPYDPEQLPAQMIHPKQGKVMWLADPSAAAMLAPNGKRTV
jgi:6-phosphogluconolactonase